MIFNQYPYINENDLNLDYILLKIREIAAAVKEFINAESLKFADPIVWDISKQYAKGTIVLDVGGNAYLSKIPIPAGVQLNNNDYWLEIFNFADYVRTANENLTINVEMNTTRATHAYNVDDWLLYDDVLYKVTNAIAVDDLLVVNTNIVHFTVEDFLKAFITYATGLINQYKNDIDASELAYRNQLAGDIVNATASLQAQLNLAISGATVDSEVILARVGYNGFAFDTLGDALRDQIGQACQLNIIQERQASFNPYSSVLNDEFSSALSSAGWFNDYIYGAGYIKSIHVKKVSATAGSIKLFILDLNNKVIDIITLSTSAVIDETIDINRSYDQRIKIGVQSQLLMFSGTAAPGYASYNFIANNYNIGDTIAPTAYGTLAFSFYINYYKVDEIIEKLNTIYPKITTYGEETIFSFTDIDTYSGSPASRFYASGNTYPSGYIKSIRARRALSTAYIIIVDSVTGNILYMSGYQTSDNYDINIYCPNPVYIYCYGVYYSMVSGFIGTYAEEYTTILSDRTEGSSIISNFVSGDLLLAVEITYKNIITGNLKNKVIHKQKVFICGDSITAGYPYYSQNLSLNNQDLRWGNQLARALDLDVDFGAESGNGWLYSTGSANAYSITNATDFSNYDVSIYFWGTNDYYHNMALGDPITDTSASLTVCGRIKYCIDKMLSDNRGINIILICPLNRSTAGSYGSDFAYGTANNAGWTLRDLCEAMKTICNYYRIPCIDNFISPINRNTLNNLTTDGLHPNIKGYKALGGYLTGQISNYIRPYITTDLTE